MALLLLCHSLRAQLQVTTTKDRSGRVEQTPTHKLFLPSRPPPRYSIILPWTGGGLQPRRWRPANATLSSCAKRRVHFEANERNRAHTGRTWWVRAAIQMMHAMLHRRRRPKRPACYPRPPIWGGMA